MRRWPRIVLWLGGLIGTVAWLWPFTAGASQLRALFPDLSRDDATQAMKRLWVSEGRNLLLLRSISRKTSSPVHALLGDITCLAELKPPLIIATFHAGAAVSISAAVQSLPGSSLAVMGALKDQGRRVRVIYEAVQRLRHGDFVIIAVDAEGVSAIEGPCLGRSLPLARGAFAIARITGVPIVPMLMRWQNDRAEAEIGDPITVRSAADEDIAAQALRDWLEHLLVRSPETIGVHLLERLSRR